MFPTVETHGRVGIEVADGQVVLTKWRNKRSCSIWGTQSINSKRS